MFCNRTRGGKGYRQALAGRAATVLSAYTDYVKFYIAAIVSSLYHNMILYPGILRCMSNNLLTISYSIMTE